MILNWKRLLRVPWTARRSSQSILKEIIPEYSLEELILKLQYFGHLMQRTDSLEKTLMLGKIGGRRRRGRQRMRWLDGITDSMDMSLSKSGSWWWTAKPGILQSKGSQRVGHDWATELNWGAESKGSYLQIAWDSADPPHRTRYWTSQRDDVKRDYLEWPPGACTGKDDFYSLKF